MPSNKRNWITRLFGHRTRGADQPNQPDHTASTGDTTPGSPTTGGTAASGKAGHPDIPSSNATERSASADTPSSTPNSSTAGTTHTSAAEATSDPALREALDDLSTPHPYYRGLTLEQGLSFDEELARAFTSRGYSAELNRYNVHIADPQGQTSTVHIDNLYKQVLNLPDFDRLMPHTVDEFVQNLLDTRPATEYRDADFYRGMRVRLQPIDQLLEESWARDALGLPPLSSDAATDPHTLPTEGADSGRPGVGEKEGADAREGDKNEEPRLSAADIEPLFGKDSPVRPWSQDTVIRLSFDTSKAIQSLIPGSFDDRGPVEDLYRMGFRNLWQELVDSDITITEFEPPSELAFHTSSAAVLDSSKPGNKGEEKCWLIEGESFYVGSLPLFLEEFLAERRPDLDQEKGLIFGTPHRHLTVVREVTNGASLMNSIGLMVTIVTEQYSTQPGHISPRLHLLHEGQVETFTDIVWGEDPNRAEIQVKPSPYLMAQISDGLDDDEWPGLGGPEAPEA